MQGNLGAKSRAEASPTELSHGHALGQNLLSVL